MPEERESKKESFGLMESSVQKRAARTEDPPKKKKAAASIPKEGVLYLSVKKNQRIRIRPPIKQFINGREFKTPGLAVSFTSNQLRTKNPEVIEALDEMLYGEGALRWRKLFYRAPSSKTIEAMTEAATKAKAVEDEVLKKSLGDEGIQEMNEWNRFLDKRKKNIGNLTTKPKAVRT